MAFEYICRYYNVPACIGRGVVIDGQSGVIVEDMGNYIGVVMDGEKATDVRPYHPDSKVVYGDMRTVPKLTRSQKNYRDFLNADSGMTFREWLSYRKD